MEQPEVSQVEHQVRSKVQSTLADQLWRLNNLYTIENKQGQIVRFQPNEAQLEFYHAFWYLNVILKARQLGFSTMIAVLWLDISLFNSTTRCGIVDATIDDAKKKLRKIILAYKHLPEYIRNWRPITSANAQSIEFANGSGIEVGTSHRGGTLQYLHVSELGKIAAKYPEKAREIRTGAINTIQAGQFCVIESTAEGQEGDFYDICQTAETKHRTRSNLSLLDYKFHFFPWHQAPEYTINPDGVIISEPMQRYFTKLERQEGIRLTPGQKAWYVKKAEIQRDDMKREFPSTPKEAFEASVEGAIFGPQMITAEERGRIGDFKAVPDVPVHTFWDIGRTDYTSIWFAQILFGPKIRVVGYYQNCLLELPHYTEYCFGTEHTRKVFPELVFKEDTNGIFERNGWIKGQDYFPHDIRVTEWGSGRSRIEQAIAAGFNFKQATDISLHDGINAARATIPLCEFDAEGCAEGLRCLRSYRWKWDDINSRWVTGEPRHGTDSHGADAYRYLATSWREIVPDLPKSNVERVQLVVAPDMIRNSDHHATGININMSVDEIFKAIKKQQEKQGARW